MAVAWQWQVDDCDYFLQRCVGGGGEWNCVVLTITNNNTLFKGTRWTETKNGMGTEGILKGK